MREKPRIIALCGKPKSGKTTLAEILKRNLNYEIIDDAIPMRQIGVAHFGLSVDDVTTQSGKARELEFMDRQWTVREILGEIGNALEDKFGPDVIPYLAFIKMNEYKNYVLPSVRRDQALFWKSKGALVIEVDNPHVPESPYEFDRYNKSAVDLTLFNDFHPVKSLGLSRSKSHNQLYMSFRKLLDEEDYSLVG